MKTSSETSRKAAARAARAWLQSTWPLSVGAYLPLAVGVREAIIAAASDLHSPRAISDALRAHVASPKYVAALSRPGAVRVSLSGEPVEPVSPDHQAHAAAVAAQRAA
jgi:sRNA-binding protein